LESQKKDEEIVLDHFPKEFHEEVSIYYSNRGLCFMHLDNFEKTISDCSKSIQLNPKYSKSLMRRAKAYESLKKYSEALKDHESIIELDPTVQVALEAKVRLPPLIKEQQEKEKEEMLGKLKGLANSALGWFGLSTNDFKMTQDHSGSWNLNFNKQK